MPADEREKISLFTNVVPAGVISMWDVDTIYKVPRMLHEQRLDELICMKLQLLTTREPDRDPLAVAISSLEAVLALETPGELSAADLVGVEVVA